MGCAHLRGHHRAKNLGCLDIVDTNWIDAPGRTHGKLLHSAVQLRAVCCICYSECVKSGNVYISWNFQGIYTFLDSLRDCIYSLIFSGNLHVPWKIELIFDTFPENVISSRPEIDTTKIDRACRRVFIFNTVTNGLQLEFILTWHAGMAATITFQFRFKAFTFVWLASFSTKNSYISKSFGRHISILSALSESGNVYTHSLIWHIHCNIYKPLSGGLIPTWTIKHRTRTITLRWSREINEFRVGPLISAVCVGSTSGILRQRLPHKTSGNSPAVGDAQSLAWWRVKIARSE